MQGLDSVATDPWELKDESFFAEAQQALEEALQRLTGLTSLLIEHTPGNCIVPQALSGLSRLQELYLLFSWGTLPCGPWSGSLRSLGAPLECLEGSTQLLATCGALQEVALLSACTDYAPGPFWQWARQHPRCSACSLAAAGCDTRLPQWRRSWMPWSRRGLRWRPTRAITHARFSLRMPFGRGAATTVSASRNTQPSLQLPQHSSAPVAHIK